MRYVVILFFIFSCPLSSEVGRFLKTMEEEYIITKIKELMPDEHQDPQGVLYTALKSAIQKDLADTLNKLLRDKKLSYNKTLNDLLIRVAE